jgi:integrase
VFIVAVLNWAIGFKVKGRQLITANPFGAPAPGVRRTLARPKNLAPMRPIATWDRFLKIRAKADQVLMFARKGDVGAVLVETGRAQFTRGEGPVHLWMRPSYLPELLDLAEATGRRISAICRLWYSDFIREGGVVTKIRWRPFKGAAEKIVPLSAEGRAAVARILLKRGGHGDTWVFPSPRKPHAADHATARARLAAEGGGSRRRRAPRRRRVASVPAEVGDRAKGAA